MRGKNILTIVVSLVIALIFCMPGQIIAEEETPEPLAPILPFEIWGQMYIDEELAETLDYTLMTLVNDTVFGYGNMYADSGYQIDTYGDHTDTPEVREGGYNGDLVYYLLKKNDGVPGRRWMCADETFTFVSGGLANTDLHFSSTGSPWPVKISSVTPNPSSGNDLITLCNPGNETVSLDDWKLRDRDGWEMPLSGSISAAGEITIDLGGDILSNAVDGGSTSGDELSLCWQDPLGTMGGGEWVAIDQVEYGNHNDYWDNTTLGDYPVTPAEGFRIVRTPELYTDNDNCTTDFTVEEVPEPAATADVILDIGWNLVSLPIIPDNTSIESVLSSIAGSYDSVKYYDAYDTADPWKSYSPYKSPSVNDLYFIDETMGVWLRTTAPCTLTVEGTEPMLTNISLKTGWNLVGYPSDYFDTAVDSLIGTGYDMPVETYDQASPYLISDSDYVATGKGYWVHVPADSTWSVWNIPSNPYPVYGYVELYDGTSAGGYSPLASSGNASVEVSWWNDVGGWSNVSTITNELGQYSVDLFNYLDGDIVYVNATFDASYGNNGYNYTAVDIMMGSSMQNVVCGVPYEIMFIGAPPMVMAGTPWVCEYEILDRDNMRAQGYFTHIDGPLDFRSSDPLFVPPPLRTFEGTADITPGYGSEALTFYTIDDQTVEVFELTENSFLTPWYDFYLDPGSTVPGWNTDSAITYPMVI